MFEATVKKVKDTINNTGMLSNTDKVYVATSGGADSMALLSFLNSMKSEFNIEIAAVHVNHGIRGETARRDADFVKDYCNKNNIEYVLFSAEDDEVIVPSNASEEWARQLRYGYLDTLIKPGVKIATAHTLSDQMETVLFRMARGGSGLNGLVGIPTTRGNYIRPFINITRTEVEEIVEHFNGTFITDETNLGDGYSRNKIRHYVVPVLKQINPNAEESIGKMCSRLEKAQKYIEKQAKLQLYSGKVIEGIKYTTDAFIGIDEIILDEMIIQLLSKINIQSEQKVELIKNSVYKAKNGEINETLIDSIQLSNTYSIVITSEYITIVTNGKAEKKPCKEGINIFDRYGYTVNIEEVSAEEFKCAAKNKYNLCKYADAEKLNLSECLITGKLYGDRFKPACRMEGKLVKFMRSIPLAERYGVPVIRVGDKIIWVWGLGFTDGYTPDDNSKKIYKVTWDNKE